ncbi:hypothetical protein [uncultured Pedobacter sp.]|uniref:hypothetical protein n=1 Tax=uncultured Pedobacter sp. TaxID=246139 RepID=UPI0025D21A2A|nr:hypothetical protein [uncultured Pedobacter sp.]
MLDQDNFIDSLKRDRARGNLAPHQIILLISFFNLGKDRLTIHELVSEFDKNWETYKHLFKSNNRNIGMPLKAMLNNNLITIETFSSIENHRNTREILSKIILVSLSETLTEFFTSVNKEYLETRIEF